MSNLVLSRYDAEKRMSKDAVSTFAQNSLGRAANPSKRIIPERCCGNLERSTVIQRGASLWCASPTTTYCPSRRMTQTRAPPPLRTIGNVDVMLIEVVRHLHTNHAHPGKRVHGPSALLVTVSSVFSREQIGEMRGQLRASRTEETQRRDAACGAPLIGLELLDATTTVW